MKIAIKIFHYFIFFLFGIASCGFWRGIWYLNNYFVFPDDYQVSFITSMVGGFIILMCVQRSGSVIAPPMILPTDGELIKELHKMASFGKS